MGDMQILTTVGSLPVTAYAALMALAALLGTAMTVLLGRKRIGVSNSLSLSLWTIVCAVLGGHIAYTLCMFGYYESGLLLLFKPWLGGYTLYGAVLGGLLGAWLCGRVHALRTALVYDIAAPGAMLAIAVGRAAEMVTDQGLGDYVDNEALQFFPAAVQDMYGEFRTPVFAWEAAAALVIMIVLLVMFVRVKREGSVACTMLTLLGTSQILLEQLRMDEYLRFGFVRFTQLAAIITVAAVMALRMIPQFREKRVSLWTWLRIGMFVCGVLVVIFIEFAFEKPQFLPVLRVCIGLTGALCAAALATGCGKRNVGICLAVLAAAVTVAVLVPLHMAMEWENQLLVGVMAAVLAVIAVAVLYGGNKQKA